MPLDPGIMRSTNVPGPREFLVTKRGRYRRRNSNGVTEAEDMTTARKKQIRVIKLSTLNDVTELQDASLSAKKLLEDPMNQLRCTVSRWVAEFKGRCRQHPKTTFQALFKE
jgi:hypothetical protein